MYSSELSVKLAPDHTNSQLLDIEAIMLIRTDQIDLIENEQLSPSLVEKYQKLQVLLRDMQRVVVAFSGGVDSTLAARVAFDTLGADNTLQSSPYPPV